MFIQFNILDEKRFQIEKREKKSTYPEEDGF